MGAWPLHLFAIVDKVIHGYNFFPYYWEQTKQTALELESGYATASMSVWGIQ